MKKFTLFLLSCFAIHANAATSITTPTVSGHWTLAGSPYNVYNDIEVASGQSLTIDPGVSVLFQGSYRFQVNGILYAVGTASQQINFSVADTTGFTTDTLTLAGGWHGLQLSTYGGTGTDTSAIAYCNITYTKFDSTDYHTTPMLGAFVIQRNMKISNCNFYQNRTIDYYAVYLFYIYYGYSAEFASCSFYNNYTGQIEILLAAGSANIHDSKIYQNYSEENIMTFIDGTLTFINNDVYQNVLTGYVSAEGILTSYVDAMIKGNQIHDNICVEDASIYCGAGFVSIIDNIICNNQHTTGLCGIVDGGGGLNLCWNNGSPHDSTYYTVRNNIIANNYSPFEAGGIKIYNAGATITNNQIINNASVNHAAIYIFDNDTSNYIIKNNIFYGNTLTSATDLTSTIIDAIIYYGNIEYDHNWQQRPTAYELNVSGTGFTTSGDTTTNIIGTDPGMIAPTPSAIVTASALTANFNLQSTSDCINKGDTTGIVTEPTDYMGQPRISGSSIDIGAYEYTPGALNTPYTYAPVKQMQVFPNPAASVVYVSVPGAKGTLTMMDMSGRQVLQTTVTNTLTSLDIHTLDRGIYFIVCDDGINSKAVQKIVVE